MDILTSLTYQDGIYSFLFSNNLQKEEEEMRNFVAEKKYVDYLSEISRHHSIPVMDKELELFLKNIPLNGHVLDVGGGWGWHWRSIHRKRPDLKIFLLDMIKGNFVHAKNLLKDLIGKQIFLIHGNLLHLPFPENSFDGVWSVQTIQHIPNFKDAVLQCHRVLKQNGIFANYSLNESILTKIIYKLLGKKYHSRGFIEKTFYLERASNDHVTILKSIFKNNIKRRYSEILFTPKIKGLGTAQSKIAGLDCYLSNSYFFKALARQQSLHVKK